MPRPRRVSIADGNKGKKGQLPHEVESRLIETIRRLFETSASPKEALEAACREIARTDEGIRRLVLEALTGDRDSFWTTIERGFGKSPQVVELAGKMEQVISVEGLSEGLLDFLAGLESLKARGAKVRTVIGARVEDGAERALPSTSDNECSVNSDQPRKRRLVPDF